MLLKNCSKLEMTDGTADESLDNVGLSDSDGKDQLDMFLASFTRSWDRGIQGNAQGKQNGDDRVAVRHSVTKTNVQGCRGSEVPCPDSLMSDYKDVVECGSFFAEDISEEVTEPAVPILLNTMILFLDGFKTISYHGTQMWRILVKKLPGNECSFKGVTHPLPKSLADGDEVDGVPIGHNFGAKRRKKTDTADLVENKEASVVILPNDSHFRNKPRVGDERKLLLLSSSTADKQAGGSTGNPQESSPDHLEPWYPIEESNICVGWNCHAGTIRWYEVTKEFSDSNSEYPVWTDHISELIKMKLSEDRYAPFLVCRDPTGKPCEPLEGLWFRATDDEIADATKRLFFSYRVPTNEALARKHGDVSIEGGYTQISAAVFLSEPPSSAAPQGSDECSDVTFAEDDCSVDKPVDLSGNKGTHDDDLPKCIGGQPHRDASLTFYVDGASQAKVSGHETRGEVNDASAAVYPSHIANEQINLTGNCDQRPSIPFEKPSLRMSRLDDEVAEISIAPGEPICTISVNPCHGSSNKVSDRELKPTNEMMSSLPHNYDHTTLAYNLTSQWLLARKDVLEELFTVFRASGTVAYLVGSAGVGRSFLAEGFTKKWTEQDPRRTRFWIRAATKSSLRNSLMEILEQVVENPSCVEYRNAETQQLANRVSESLAHLSHWILVVDGIPDDGAGFGEVAGFESVIDSLVVQIGRGRILVTSRGGSSIWDIRSGSVTKVRVVPISKTEAKSLFLDNVPCRDNEDLGAARVLVADHFGGLPMAIVTASSEICFSGVPVKRYLEKLSSTGKKVGKVETILESGLQYARSRDLGQVLDVVAWLNPDQIERRLLPADDEAVEMLCALNILRKSTWVYQDVSYYSIHRLFQSVARQGSPSPAAALEVLKGNGLARFSRHDLETWGPAFRMLPHLDSIRACFRRNEIVGRDELVAFADAMAQGGHVAMWASCDYAEAKESYQLALDILSQVYSCSQHDDRNNIRLATAMKDLGRLHQALGEYSSALDMYGKALAMMRTCNGSDASLTIATMLHNIGRVCFCLGKLDDAEQHFKTALNMKKSVSDSQQSLAMTKANIAKIYQARGRPKEAVKEYKEIEKMSSINYETAFGATVLLNEGQIYQDLGDLNQARRKYNQALEKSYQVFGSEAKNDAIAMAHCYLGSLLVDTSDLDGARFHLSTALVMMKNVFGATANHESIANVHYHLGRLFEKDGDQRSARMKYNEAKLMLDVLSDE